MSAKLWKLETVSEGVETFTPTALSRHAAKVRAELPWATTPAFRLDLDDADRNIAWIPAVGVSLLNAIRAHEGGPPHRTLQMMDAMARDMNEPDQRPRLKLGADSVVVLDVPDRLRYEKSEYLPGLLAWEALGVEVGEERNRFGSAVAVARRCSWRGPRDRRARSTRTRPRFVLAHDGDAKSLEECTAIEDAIREPGRDRSEVRVEPLTSALKWVAEATSSIVHVAAHAPRDRTVQVDGLHPFLNAMHAHGSTSFVWLNFCSSVDHGEQISGLPAPICMVTLGDIAPPTKSVVRAYGALARGDATRWWDIAELVRGWRAATPPDEVAYAYSCALLMGADGGLWER